MKPVCIVVADRGELPPAERIWGTGGWTPPEKRQALDWLTLISLCGWEVGIVYVDDPRPDLARADLIVFAGGPPRTPEWEELSLRRARDGAAVIQPAGALNEQRLHPTPAAVAGTRVSWLGPGERTEWSTEVALQAVALQADPEVEVWAALDGRAVVAALSRGRGKVVSLGFSASSWRDASGVGSALLRHLLAALFRDRDAPVDHTGLLVLRMDDPGSSQSTWCRSWAYPKLRQDQWDQVSRDLSARDARLTIGYVPGWVDDGDPGRGVLEVDGRPVPRKRGAIHDSWRVRYRDVAGVAPGTVHDLVSEYEGICALIRRNHASVELHGLTHMTPNAARWAAAEDRYDSMHWYRELGSEELMGLASSEHPLTLARARLQEAFGTEPTTLIPPGDEWTNHSLEVALDLGVQLVDSYYLALRVNDRFCWITHVCAPYLDQPDQKWFTAGLPVVGYFHDYELAVYGVDWMTSLLDRWEAAGAKRMTDLRTLTHLLGVA